MTSRDSRNQRAFSARRISLEKFALAERPIHNNTTNSMLLPTNSAPKQSQRLLGVRATTPANAAYSTTNILLPSSYERNAHTSTIATSTNRLPRTYGPSHRHTTPHPRSAPTMKPIVAITVVVATLAIALTLSVLTQFKKQPEYPFGKPDPSLKLPVNISSVEFLYSTAIPTVGSKAIEDMLVANALAFNEKKTFGGACGVIGADVKAQNEALIKSLGLESELFYACPLANDTKAITLTSAQYEYMSWRDTELMSPEWIKLLQKKIAYPKSSGKKKSLSIVAHIQRGSITPCIGEYVRYLPNLHFQLLIKRYYKPGKSNVTIISQSPSFESFQNFTASGYQVRLNRSIEEDWLEMLSADVLIMSRSSYSFVPAIFNRNVVVYTHYWHEPLPQWNVVPADITSRSSEVVAKLRAKQCHSATKGFNLQQQQGATDDNFQSGVQQGV